MGKDAYDKLKILSEVLRNNWPIFVIAFTALGSMATNAAQFVTNQDLETSKVKAVREVAVGFQQAMIKTEPKKIIMKSSCDKCMHEIKRLREEFH